MQKFKIPSENRVRKIVGYAWKPIQNTFCIVNVYTIEHACQLSEIKQKSCLQSNKSQKDKTQAVLSCVMGQG